MLDIAPNFAGTLMGIINALGIYLFPDNISPLIFLHARKHDGLHRSDDHGPDDQGS